MINSIWNKHLGVCSSYLKGRYQWTSLSRLLLSTIASSALWACEPLSSHSLSRSFGRQSCTQWPRYHSCSFVTWWSTPLPGFLKDVAGDEIRQRNNKTSTDNLGVVMGVVFSALCSKTGGVSKFMEYGQLWVYCMCRLTPHWVTLAWLGNKHAPHQQFLACDAHPCFIYCKTLLYAKGLYHVA